MNDRYDVLLISGTAGSYTLRGKDLEGSVFDEVNGKRIIEKYYRVDGAGIIPQNAYYFKDGEKCKVLRYNRSSYPILVTRALEDILEKNQIAFHSIPCDTIWEMRPFTAAVPIVCLSTTFMWSEKMIERAIAWIRTNVKYSHLMIGGHYSSVKYDYIMNQYDNVDCLIVGDGETAMPMVVRYWLGDTGSRLEDIPNLVFWKNGRLVKTRVQYESLEQLEKVSYQGHFDRLSYESVRGCAFGCKFCTWDAGIKYFRYKSARRIVKDFEEYIAENEVKRIEINDSTFLFPFSRVDEVLDGLIRLGLHWKAHSRCDIPMNDALMKKLDESHCDILQIGFESMNDRILKNMAKKTTAKQNRYANEMFKKCMVDTVVSFIVGFPDETIAEFKNTQDYIVREHFGHFYIFVFEMEDKSLDIWKEREQYGFILLDDKEDCLHGGSHWKHNGMTSEQAFMLREELLKSVRKNNSLAIYKSWQSPYEWPFVEGVGKLENMRIERLLDNLAFLQCDYPESEIAGMAMRIQESLREYGVYFDDETK